MKPKIFNRRRGFTLLETVIAIGVLAVLLTGFMVVFAPAAAGIRQAINVQEADRLASTLEQELVNLRDGDASNLSGKTGGNYTGFDKAFDWIQDSDSADKAVFVYQYRGNLASKRPDNTLEPVTDIKNKLPGEDYVVVPMARRKDDAKFLDDLKAVEGSVYLVKCTQLIFSKTSGDGLILGTPGTIEDPKGGTASSNPDNYPEAVVAFSAEFFQMPSKSADYFSAGAFSSKFPNLKNPVFSRNLAVRR
jgi:prepilin-type N-terminal cleavage/methylation domain-containing protein